MSKIVLLDAGHNQYTSGKQSPDGVYKEYQFTIDVRDRLAKHLKRHGVTVEYIDSEKKGSAELIELVNKANKFPNSIYVSIHSNAYTSNWNSASGWEIFCYGTNTKSEGYKLASCIRAASIPALGMKDRGIKDGSDLYVIRKTTMPAVLIEHGFHTNKEEVAKLKSADFKEKIAICDCKGILNYLGITWKDEVVKEETTASDVIYKVQVGAFSVKSNADKLVTELKSKGYSAVIVKE